MEPKASGAGQFGALLFSVASSYMWTACCPFSFNMLAARQLAGAASSGDHSQERWQCCRGVPDVEAPLARIASMLTCRLRILVMEMPHSRAL